MMRMNFVGVQREIECLFHRYDDNCDGTVDYLEFSRHILGQHEKPHPLRQLEARSIVERVRNAIKSRDEASGFHGLNRILARMDFESPPGLLPDALDDWKTPLHYVQLGPSRAGASCMRCCVVS